MVWTGGVRANDLVADIPGDRDRFGRLPVAPDLRAPSSPMVFVAGDCAAAATDDEGNKTLMSCQHASMLGRVAGRNAAADLLGLETVPYRQPKYVTCLDLGGWGAVLTKGWDRQIKLTRDEAKAVKREINTVWIYPPASKEAAWQSLAVTDPDLLIPL